MVTRMMMEDMENGDDLDAAELIQQIQRVLLANSFPKVKTHCQKSDSLDCITKVCKCLKFAAILPQLVILKHACPTTTTTTTTTTPVTAPVLPKRPQANTLQRLLCTIHRQHTIHKGECTIQKLIYYQLMQ